MSISSNSIIHFTNSLENLYGILSNGFRVKYCLEENKFHSKTLRAAVPMVSFCELPLSEVKDHIKSYGHYGIGLKKEWAIKERLNPVLYIESNSMLGENISSAFGEFIKNGEKKTQAQRQLLDLFRYIKTYERDLQRDGKMIKNYKFYNEREWRYTPDIEKKPMIVSAKLYQADKDKFNSKVSDIYLLPGINDIKYVILKSEDEISDLIDFLRKQFKKSSTAGDLDTLITRIVTVQQIKTDF